MIIYIIVGSIISGGFSAFIAKEKNRSAMNWFWLGFFFNLFALIAISAVPPISSSSIHYESVAATGGGLKSWICPNCKTLNGFAIDVCHKCGAKK